MLMYAMETRIDLDQVEESDVKNKECTDALVCPYCNTDNIQVIATKCKLLELVMNLAEGSLVTCQNCGKMFHVRGMLSIQATTKPIENVICNDKEFLKSSYQEIDKSNEYLKTTEGRGSMKRRMNDAKEWNLYQRYIRPYLHNKEIDESTK